MIKKQLPLILIFLCISFTYFLSTFHFQRVVSWITIDLLNPNQYYQDIEGEVNMHKINIQSFSVIAPKSFHYVAPQFARMEDTFIGYIANSESKIFFEIDGLGLSGIDVPLTEEESMERYGHKDYYKSYDIKQDSVLGNNELIYRKIANNKKSPYTIWLSLSFATGQYPYLLMETRNVSAENKENIIKIFESIRVK